MLLDLVLAAGLPPLTVQFGAEDIAVRKCVRLLAAEPNIYDLPREQNIVESGVDQPWPFLMQRIRRGLRTADTLFVYSRATIERPKSKCFPGQSSISPISRRRAGPPAPCEIVNHQPQSALVYQTD
jgi:hypothetical protein